MRKLDWFLLILGMLLMAIGITAIIYGPWLALWGLK